MPDSNFLEEDSDTPSISFELYKSHIKSRQAIVKSGRIREVKGYMVKACNPGLEVGAACRVSQPHSSQKYYGEVVGFEGDSVFVMLFDDVYGISPISRLGVKCANDPYLFDRFIHSFPLKLRLKLSNAQQGALKFAV